VAVLPSVAMLPSSPLFGITAVATVWLLSSVSVSAAASSSSNATNSSSGLTSDSGGRQLRPIDKGLRPLYVMTETFLDVVQPVSRGYIFDDHRFDKGEMSSNAGL
jgi:hypothetical protein